MIVHEDSIKLSKNFEKCIFPQFLLLSLSLSLSPPLSLFSFFLSFFLSLSISNYLTYSRYIFLLCVFQFTILLCIFKFSFLFSLSFCAIFFLKLLYFSALYLPLIFLSICSPLIYSFSANFALCFLFVSLFVILSSFQFRFFFSLSLSVLV